MLQQVLNNRLKFQLYFVFSLLITIQSCFSRSSYAAPRVTDSCVAIISLHLAAEAAASSAGVSIDVKLAKKLSGVSSKQYAGHMQNYRAQLGIRDVPTIRELAVKLGCAQVRRTREELQCCHQGQI